MRGKKHYGFGEGKLKGLFLLQKRYFEKCRFHKTMCKEIVNPNK